MSKMHKIIQFYSVIKNSDKKNNYEYFNAVEINTVKHSQTVN